MNTRKGRIMLKMTTTHMLHTNGPKWRVLKLVSYGILLLFSRTLLCEAGKHRENMLLHHIN